MKNNQPTRDLLAFCSGVALALAGLSVMWKTLVNERSDAAYAVSFVALGIMAVTFVVTMYLVYRVVATQLKKRK